MRPYIALSILFSLLLQQQLGFAQSKEDAIKLEVSGFIWNELIYDSRKTISSRGGHVLLFPANRNIDANGTDINDSRKFSIANIHSRTRLKITIPQYLKAKVTGLLEGDFVGSGSDKIGILRLRHAMIKMEWDRAELLLGQFWHPMFPLEAFPQVISWGGGLPYHPLSRNPQIRYSYLPHPKLKCFLSINAQLDLKSPGPDGPSSKYLQDSGIPELNIGLRYGSEETFLLGTILGLKTIKPMLSYEWNGRSYKSNEMLTSYHTNLYARCKVGQTTWRGGIIYGQNMYNFVMIGGYGLATPKSNGTPTYVNLTTSSYWIDFDSDDFKKKFKVGLYIGYTQNHGANQIIAGEVFARGADIAYAYRIAPRMTYGKELIRFRIEAVYHAAAYGTPNEQYQVELASEVTNYRIVFATSLTF